MSEIQRYIEIIEKLNIKIQEEQAKVQELEERIDSLCKAVNYWKNERQSTYVADAIEEMLNEIPYDLDNMPTMHGVPLSVTQTIINYADKLEANDE